MTSSELQELHDRYLTMNEESAVRLEQRFQGLSALESCISRFEEKEPGRGFNELMREFNDLHEQKPDECYWFCRECLIALFFLTKDTPAYRIFLERLVIEFRTLVGANLYDYDKLYDQIPKES